MHKGRQYRQVLPHNLTPDMISRSAPVRLLGFFAFIYAGNPIEAISDISETLKVDLPTLSIQWRGKITYGAFEFAYLFQQRLFDHQEGINYQVAVIDNVGGLMRGEWQWTFDQPGWAEGTGGEFTMGTFIASASSGLFGEFDGVDWFPVHYHDEP